MPWDTLDELELGLDAYTGDTVAPTIPPIPLVPDRGGSFSIAFSNAFNGGFEP